MNTWTDSTNSFVQALQKDSVVIFPTDTVWGLGCLVTSKTAIKKLYTIKQREPEKPTAILVGSIEQAKEYGVFNDQAEKLAKKYWPGALTIVVKATEKVPREILGPNKTVGIRFPDFKFVQQLAKRLGAGLATGSANFAGRKPPMSREEIDPSLLKKVDASFEGECGGQPPSTIVDCTSSELKIIRQGAVNV